MKIFIIDDDEISIFFTERSLQMGGFEAQIQTFLSAQEALNKLRNTHLKDLPDIIFLDLNMPHVNGWEFLESFKQLSQEKALEKCLIYILTSSLDISDIDKAYGNQLVKGYIHKPISLEDIQAIIHLN
ncbi:hypothetical protein AAE02nite_26070 [Adhaeribacter aerolatus]|uniref:Response regulatory domain-containing protein n=1 Tax=Adhaeribacter aerolatus TaxID=670289 RepID=A0A512AYZ5_9BACT|nr:response regulator [Adhaeribacter aerolatus]GEO04943.1 hypothetical protein AAE02nite_26070 [Adhaeribacter aerolatus]